MSFPRYPTYKPSGVEWLGEVPEHWETLRLRFAVTLNPSKQEAKELGEQELVSFLPMEAIGEDGTLRLENEREVAECLSGYTYFRDGDVCVAKITPCFENGKGAILRGLKGGIGFGTTELIVARPEKEKITSEFLDYLFRSQTFRRLGESEMYGAGGQKRVTDSFVRDFTAALPSIEEQNQATSFLTHETAKIDALITEQQRLIELLQEKRQAVISHAVTKGLNPDAPMKDSGVEWLGEVPEHWDVKSCRNIASIGRGASPRPAGDSRYFGGDFIPWVTVAEITKDCSMGLCSTEQYLTEEGAVNSTVFSSGTVIYSNSGATLGVPKILKIDCCANDGVVGFRGLDLSLRPEFLYHFLWQLTDSIREWAKQGQGQPNLNTDIIKSIKIPLPPLEEQVDILRKLDEDLFVFDSLVSEADKAQLLLGERRSALISAAVTGQIDVRGLVPEAEAA
jgi:type I restriction enzyme S subunit